MNIIEIAKLAGVSKSTVSRYLNQGSVSEDAREKIKKVIEETGFMPLRHAQSMRTNKTNLIGVIVPRITTEAVAKVVEGITEITALNGYEVIIANTSLSIEKEKNYLKIFKNNYVDGIIFMATQMSQDHEQLMKELQVPIVVAAQHSEHFVSVSHADYEAAKVAVCHLIAKDHEKIAFIGVHDEDIAVGLNRRQGYLDALAIHRIPVEDQYIKIGDFKAKSGYTLAEQLMTLENRPSAIFAVTDHLAVGAMNYLQSHGYNVPEDVAIIGMGDSEIGQLMIPKLTTIKYPYREMGSQCAELLMDQIKNGKIISPKNESNFIMSYRLIKRDSV